MEIRRAQTKDIPDILNLLTQVNKLHHDGRPDIFKLHTKYTHDELDEIIQDDTRPIFVAVGEDGHVEGYGFCVYQQILNDNIRTDIRTLYIDDICVDEKARGHHVGKSIYEHIMKFAKENGFYNITLNVWALNPVAEKFYQAMGMKPLRTTMETIL